MTFNGRIVFSQLSIFHHLDLPKLKVLKMGNKSFMGDMALQQRSTNEEPYNYKNQLTLRCIFPHYWKDVILSTSFTDLFEFNTSQFWLYW